MAWKGSEGEMPECIHIIPIRIRTYSSSPRFKYIYKYIPFLYICIYLKHVMFHSLHFIMTFRVHANKQHKTRAKKIKRSKGWALYRMATLLPHNFVHIEESLSTGPSNFIYASVVLERLEGQDLAVLVLPPKNLAHAISDTEDNRRYSRRLCQP